tara:strand:+ start:1666 stop:2313 length:648 start_codon:yes stop_codon:yes gene_type:complete
MDGSSSTDDDYANMSHAELIDILSEKERLISAMAGNIVQLKQQLKHLTNPRSVVGEARLTSQTEVQNPGVDVTKYGPVKDVVASLMPMYVDIIFSKETEKVLNVTVSTFSSENIDEEAKDAREIFSKAEQACAFIGSSFKMYCSDARYTHTFYNPNNYFTGKELVECIEIFQKKARQIHNWELISSYRCVLESFQLHDGKTNKDPTTFALYGYLD